VSPLDREGFEEACRLRWEKKITENEFVRRTAPTWRRLSRTIYSAYRSRLPAWAGREDVEQELVLRALRHLPDWRPGGTTISSFVRFCATHRTKRELDSWRGASTSGNSGKNPGRSEVAFSTLEGNRSDEAREDIGSRQAAEEFDPVEHLDSEAEFGEAMRKCRTVRQAFVAIALRAAGGDVAGAARLLMRNGRMRLECGMLRDEAHAQRVVREVVEELLDLVEVLETVEVPWGDFFDAPAATVA
jgi:DNA-directed RNA polymerase specialized sigma24 family protein